MDPYIMEVNHNGRRRPSTRLSSVGKRRSVEGTVLGIRYYSSEEDSEEEPVRTGISETLQEVEVINLNSSKTKEPKSPAKRRNLNELKPGRQIHSPPQPPPTPKEQVSLVDEQRSFKEELDNISKANFSVEHLLSNCALKVENLNRKLLLVEYELSDFNGPEHSDNMKWEHTEDPAGTPLRRSSKPNTSSLDTPLFDDGMHKLEKFAKIHGIVDVEIEMYNSAEGDTTTDTRDSEGEDNTFSYGTESRDDVTNQCGDVTNKCGGGLNKDKTGEESGVNINKSADGTECENVMEQIEAAYQISLNQTPSIVINNTPLSDCEAPCDPVETSRDPADMSPDPPDLSDSQPSAELVYSLVDADHDIFSHSIHSNDTIEQIDIVLPGEHPPKPPSSMTSPGREEFLGVGEEDVVGSWVDDVLSQYDRETSREKECMSDSALSNGGVDYKLETISSSTFSDIEADQPEAEEEQQDVISGRSKSPLKRLSSGGSSTASSPKSGSGSSGKRPSITSPTEGRTSRASRGSSHKMEETPEENEEAEEAEEEAEDQVELELEDIFEDDELVLRRRESEAVDKLLESLEITEDDLKKTYNSPSVTIETGVEEGAPKLRDHKIELDGSEKTDERLTSPFSESQYSVFGAEDSDEERRKKWRERPFPKRAARSFFSRLCACWHH